MLGNNPDRLMAAGSCVRQPLFSLLFLPILSELSWKRQHPSATVDGTRSQKLEEQARSGWRQCSTALLLAAAVNTPQTCPDMPLPQTMPKERMPSAISTTLASHHRRWHGSHSLTWGVPSSFHQHRRACPWRGTSKPNHGSRQDVSVPGRLHIITQNMTALPAPGASLKRDVYG